MMNTCLTRVTQLSHLLKKMSRKADRLSLSISLLLNFCHFDMLFAVTLCQGQKIKTL